MSTRIGTTQWCKVVNTPRPLRKASRRAHEPLQLWTKKVEETSTSKLSFSQDHGVRPNFDSDLHCLPLSAQLVLLYKRFVTRAAEGGLLNRLQSFTSSNPSLMDSVRSCVEVVKSVKSLALYRTVKRLNNKMSVCNISQLKGHAACITLNNLNMLFAVAESSAHE